MNGVKHPGQKCERHDNEILKGRNLVKLFSPDASNDAEIVTALDPNTCAIKAFNTLLAKILPSAK